MTILYIFLGGGLGSLCRFGMGLLTDIVWAGQFPLGTFLSNLCASFLLGIFSAISFSSQPPALQAGWMAGFCGGFSTFSTFSAENMILIEENQWVLFSLNILLNVVFCILAFSIGYRVAN